MWFPKTGVTAPVGSAALHGQQLGMPQAVDASKERTVKVGGAAGQPLFVLQVSAEGSWGKVQVRDEQSYCRNLTSTKDHWIVTSSVGPTNPRHAAYRIADAEGSRHFHTPGGITSRRKTARSASFFSNSSSASGRPHCLLQRSSPGTTLQPERLSTSATKCAVPALDNLVHAVGLKAA
jgi:hypothetical protein